MSLTVITTTRPTKGTTDITYHKNTKNTATMDKILQTGLSLGMSTTSGFHTGKPKPVPREFDGQNILPPTFCPTARD